MDAFSVYETLTKNLIVSDLRKKCEDIVYVDYSISSDIELDKFLVGKNFKIFNIIESNSIITIPCNAALFKLFENPEDGAVLSWFFQTDVYPVTIVGEMGDVEINTSCSILYLVLNSVNPILFSMYATPISGEKKGAKRDLFLPEEKKGKEGENREKKEKKIYKTITASNFLINSVTIVDTQEVEFLIDEYSNFNHLEILIFGQGKDCTLGICFNEDGEDKGSTEKTENKYLLGKLKDESTLLQTFIPCYRESNFPKVIKTGETVSTSNTSEPISKLKIFPISGEIINGTRIYLYIRL